MTVSYTAEVATCRGLGCFLKLLKRWKGSIYKLVWMDLLLFLFLYYGLNFMYRFLLDEPGKESFSSIVNYCREYSDLIPLSFVLGFYVSIVVTRWWSQYTTIPWPDPLAVFVSATIHGQDERGRVMRRTIMRYVCLCITMTFAMISPRVKKRFPTLEHFVEAGLLQESELAIMADLDKKFPSYSKHWLPLVWAASIITRARREGRIRDDFAVKTMIDQLNIFRGQCGTLLSYDSISVPLVYTQVVTLAVYFYFLTTLMGHQWVEGNDYKFDLYFPVFTTLQFFFYVGWLKVAESLINPFGDDDDDFEVNWMVDRNLQISYLIVDEMHHDHPELCRDQYWDEVFPMQLPHTAASAPFKGKEPQPSTTNIALSKEGETIVPPSSVKGDDQPYMNDMQSGPITFSAKPGGGLKAKGSQTSVGATVPDTISRTASVTSMLKRFFSREDQKPDAAKAESSEMAPLNPTPTTPVSKQAPTASRITETIEEVDEQNTITSQQSRKESRPTVIDLFGPPSLPIDVPGARDRQTYRSDTAVYEPFELSKSAPDQSEADRDDKLSFGGSLTDESGEDDEFEKLKRKREEERINRVLARSASMANSQAALNICSDRRSSGSGDRKPSLRTSDTPSGDFF